MNLSDFTPSVLSRHTSLTWENANRRDSVTDPYQHVLMAQITEPIEEFLYRVVRMAIPRLLEIEGEPPAENDKAYVLAAIRMAVLLRKAVDDRIAFMVVTGHAGSKAEALLDEVLGGERLLRPTWKEIGEALGVSAQAAHRKYGETARANEASREE